VHTLVSFLGRGPGRGKDYLTAKYQFVDPVSKQVWISPNCKHFAFAAYEFHQKLQSPFDNILGTSGSMWAALADSFGNVGGSAVTEFALSLIDLVDQERITQTDLDIYASELSKALSVKVQLRLIPSAAESVDQADILSQILGAVEAKEKVYLDVTHSYRHLPMIGLAAAAISASLQDAEIEDICYGAWEMRDGDVSPVVSLKWILQLFRVLNGLNELSRSQQLRPLIDCFPEGVVRDALENAAYKLDVMRIDHAASAVQVALARLDEEVASLPIELQIVVDGMKERLRHFSRLSRNPSGLTRMAELALDQDDYLRASVFLAEAVELAVARGMPENKTENRRLKTVRNWLAHAGDLDSEKKSHNVQHWVSDRKKLRQFFRNHIKRLNKELRTN